MPRPRKFALAAVAKLLVLLAVAAPASSSGNGGALVVGDSLAELTSPYLQSYLPRVPLTIDAVGGYNSYQIFDLFQESFDPSHSVVVFDAGTNDNPAYPEILAGNLRAVAAAIGDRCMVVPTIHGLTVDGIGNEGKNSVVTEFAASRPGTQTPDWAGSVATRPELMQADNLHPAPEGADYRARLIAQGIRSCLEYTSPPPPAEAALESKPELAPAGRIASRQRSVLRDLGAAIAGRTALLAAVALYA